MEKSDIYIVLWLEIIVDFLKGSMLVIYEGCKSHVYRSNMFIRNANAVEKISGLWEPTPFACRKGNLLQRVEWYNDTYLGPMQSPQSEDVWKGGYKSENFLHQ